MRPCALPTPPRRSLADLRDIGKGELVKVHGGQIAEFNPERHRTTVATLDWGIKEARRIKDWPKLEEAVDLKIEEQRRFVAWWGATVQRPGGDRQSQHSPRTRLMLCSEAERLTGMRHQRVSELARKLAQPDKYRRHLLGATYCAALLDDEHDHHDGDEWGTPVEIIEPVRAFYGGQIDCDPATNLVAQRTVRAAQYYTKEQDGLRQRWRGNTLLNGPYSNMAPWVNKAISEHEAGHTSQTICITNACMDTAWFRTLAGAASAICFPRRIKFVGPDGQVNGTPALPQALTYLGPRPDDFARAFGSVGFVVDPTRYRRAAGMAE
jgi:phage N-6-adenine-methyltransferase